MITKLFRILMIVLAMVGWAIGWWGAAAIWFALLGGATIHDKGVEI